MRPTYILLEGPGVEPLSLDEAKLALRIDPDVTAEDDDIQSKITAAREYFEAYTGQALITQKWAARLPCWPTGHSFPIERGPIRSIDSIIYFDSNGISQTVAADQYRFLTGGIRSNGLIEFVSGWPGFDLGQRSDAMTITFTAGYGEDASAVPRTIVEAIKKIFGDLYRDRESSAVGTIVSPFPQLESLIGMHRLGSIIV